MNVELSCPPVWLGAVAFNVRAASASGQTNPREFMKEAVGAAAHFTCSACREEANAPYAHQARVIMEIHFVCAGYIFM